MYTLNIHRNSLNGLMRGLLLAVVVALSIVAEAANAKYVLVIDAGHGGHDAGAVGSFSKEKDINLRTALAFGRYVERNCPDVKVIYTRKTDVFVPLHERANIANKNHADVFISIHTNSLPAGKIARGFETYTMGMRRSDEKLSAAQRENSVIAIEKDYQEHYAGYDPNSPESAIMFEFIHDNNMAQSVELAKLVQKNVCSLAGRPDKGVKQDVFLVLRETSMPACLIELGFISTPDEESMLNNEASIDKMAYGIYAAFARFKDKNAKIASYKDAVQRTDPVAAPAVEQQSVPNDNDRQQAKAERKRMHAQRNEGVAPKVETKSNNQPKREDAMPQPKKEESKPQPKVEQPVRQEQSQQPQVATDAKPVFKVQFLTGTRLLKEGDSQFKGLTGVSHYKDGNVLKYTVGEFNNFNDANNLKRQIVEKFPGAFVVAFYEGKRIDVNEARKIK